ncbi:Adaptor complexes medium subunit family protein [Histomonas meleagridis]|uniref:Adaptor complexes medium subunit family protein n=1 Tax=Histomonas meleagridis TaxID=135588 RepID=UPI0035593E9C|nr:Adaptor complexes medium subunit family protein [Histomonas meleagridis]KAH0796084.1 Adaptor complexes medium subunit family protein [Histomonas meleagridis]
MLKAIYIINKEPVPIVAKLQRGDIESDIANEICEIISSAPTPSSILPLVSNPNHSFCIKQSGEVFLAAVVDGDGQAIFYLSILDQLEELLHLYIENPLTDYGIKENFSNVYRLLDIFVDSGYPLVDDYNAMIQFIPPKGKTEKGQINTIYPWRASGFTYKKQQVLLDVTEYIDYCVSSNGKVDLSQIRGDIYALTEVNGNPKCSFQWKNSPYFEDISFHRCVDVTNFQTTHRLEMIPPQGNCLIAQYRMQQRTKPPIDVKIALVPMHGKMDIRLTVTAERDLYDTNIKWEIISPTASTLTTKNGNITITGNEISWNIGTLKNTKVAELSGGVECDESCRQTTFRIGFRIDGQLASECEIGTVQLDGAEKGAFAGAKYKTYAGKYQMRAGLA